MRRRLHWQRLRERKVGGAALHSRLMDAGVVGHSPPVPVRRTAQALGVEVVAVPTPGWTVAVTAREDGWARVWLAAESTPEVQRFALAHALGHLLHENIPALGMDGYRCCRFGGTRAERRANRFAEGLLVPLWVLERSIGSHLDIPRLAREYAVPEEVMRHRIDVMNGHPA